MGYILTLYCNLKIRPEFIYRDNLKNYREIKIGQKV
jgi:hypothetical protein